MVEHFRALRIAHHVVYFHPTDARAYVGGKIAEAEGLGKAAQVAEWRQVGQFVEQILDETGIAAPPPARHQPTQPRARRGRTPDAP